MTDFIATVAMLAQSNRVELFTFDHDFIVFVDEIKNAVDVVVTNAWLVPN